MDEGTEDCPICGRPMTYYTGLDWDCETIECDWNTIWQTKLPVDPSSMKGKLESLLTRIRPNHEVPSWVYREIEKILEEEK